MNLNFFGNFIHEDKHRGNWEQTRRSTMAERGCAAGPRGGRATLFFLSSSVRSCPSWSLTRSLYLETPIKRSPDAISEEGEKKHWNRGRTSKDWRGKLRRSHPRLIGSPPSPTSSSPSSWWRGSSTPLDYRFVEVAWSISLSCDIIV